MSATPHAAAKPVPTTESNVVVATETKQSLVSLGLLLIALFAAGVIFGRVVGGKTEESGTPTGSAATTTKTTTTKNVPSDTVLTALLGTGAALMLVGFLYPRINAIKLPGGVEIGVTPEELGQATATLQQAVEAGRLSANQLPEASARAFGAIKALKQARVHSNLSSDEVRALVDSALSHVPPLETEARA